MIRISIVIAITLFLVLSYCIHNLTQGFFLLRRGEYKKLKIISWVALLIGLAYFFERLSKLYKAYLIGKLDFYFLYLSVFSLILLHNFFKDIIIVRSRNELGISDSSEKEIEYL